MTILSVVKDVCATVGVAIPQSLFSGVATDRTRQELLSLATEMAQRIAYDYRDWTALRTTQTYAGDGVTTAFNLPANYKRMLLTSNVWRSTTSSMPMQFVADTDEWLHHRLHDEASAYGEWALFGNQMHIYPVLGIGQSAYFSYLEKNCVALASGGFGDNFLADGDSFVLDERLLKLGMIWQWKAQKGGSYAEDMGTYGDAIGVAMGHDSPGPIIIGRTPMSGSYRAGTWSWPS